MKKSKALALILILSMLMSILPITVMAEVTEPKTISADIVGDFNESSSTGFALKKATTWRNRKSETTTSGASRAAYYIFKNISAEDAAGLKTGATFSVSKKFKTGHSTTGHNKVYFAVGTSAISDTPTVEEINAYANNGKTASTTYTVENTNAQYKAEVAIPQSIIEQIEEGVTIVVGMPKCCNNGYHYGGAGTYPPVLTYDLSALKTAAFAAVNEAADALALATVFEKYQKSLGISDVYAAATEHELLTVVAEAVYNAKGEGYESLAAVVEAYSSAYQAAFDDIYTQKTIYASSVWTKDTAADSVYVKHTDSGASTTTITGKSIYYVFNNLTEGELMKALNVSFYSSHETTYHDAARKLYYYVGDQNIETADGLAAFIDGASAETPTTALTGILLDFRKFTSAGVVNCDISQLDIKDGQTLVVRIPQVNINNAFATLYASDTSKPQLKYNIDEAAMREKVLAAINSAETAEEAEALFSLYTATIGIGKEKLNYEVDYNNFVGKSFESISAVRKTFLALVEESIEWVNHTATVTQDKRQTFTGFGYTSSTSTLGGVKDSEYKEEILTEAIDGMNYKSMKLWVNMNSCIDENANVDLTKFLNSYNLTKYDQSVGYATAHGITDIMFGPTGKPAHLIDENGNLKADDETRVAYGILIADVINEMITEYNVPITMTSIVNESNMGVNAASEFAPIILALRNRLDEHGLNDIKIVAPEHSNVDDGLITFYKTLRDTYPQAYAAVDYIAVHSYNMSLTNYFGNMLWNDGKTIISTEGCNDGDAEADNTSDAASLLARTLNDINNGTTLFTQFHAFGYNKDATSLIRLNTSTKKYEKTASYDYMKLISNNFTYGTVIRKCQFDGKYVSHTYSTRKPKMIVAAGVDNNDKWIISMVNNTDDKRSALNEGFATYSDEYIKVTLTVDELKDVPEKKFLLYRTDGDTDVKEITLINGVAEINVYPRELVLLREVSTDSARVIYSNVEGDKAYIRVKSDGKMSGIYSEYDSKDCLTDVSLYEFTEGINVMDETMTEQTDKIAVMAFESLDTMKPNMNKFNCDMTKCN